MSDPQTHFTGPYEQMPSFFHWLGANWALIAGLCTALYFISRIVKFFADIVLKVSSVVKRFEAAESTLVTVATNHLPHIQVELEKTNKTMTSMDETLKKIHAHHIGEYDA
jgi:hypothetical protein